MKRFLWILLISSALGQVRSVAQSDRAPVAPLSRGDREARGSSPLGIVGSTPTTPGHYRHAWFVLEVSCLTAANVEDGRSTAYNTSEGYQESWTPFLLGKHPSGPRYAAVFVPITIGESLIAWKLESNHRRWVRLLGHGLMWGAVAGHSVGYFNNVGLQH